TISTTRPMPPPPTTRPPPRKPPPRRSSTCEGSRLALGLNCMFGPRFQMCRGTTGYQVEGLTQHACQSRLPASGLGGAEDAAQHVRAADDPDEALAGEHRHAAQPLVQEELRQVVHVGVLGDARDL